MTANTMTDAQLEAALTEWDEASKKADYWVEREKQLRTALFAANFPDPTPGTNKIRIPHGMALIADHRLNYTVDKALLAELTKEPHTAGIIEQFISYRPEVSGPKFRKLDVDSKLLVAPMITEKPGTPGLEIKPASKVRW